MMLRACARSVPTLLGLIFALIVGCPAAFAAAQLCDKRLHVATTTSTPGAASAATLFWILVAIQSIYLVLSLPKSGVTLSRSLPPILLRPYPLRPIQIVLADALGGLLDLPILFALPTFVVIVRRFAGNSSLGIVADIAGGIGIYLLLSLYLLQTAALSPLIAHGGRWLCATPRRLGSAVALLVIAVLASQFWTPASNVPVAHHTSGIASAPPMAFATWMAFLSPGFSTKAMQDVSQARWAEAVLWSVLLGASVCATLWTANWCLQQTQRATATTGKTRQRKARTLSPHFASPTLSIVAAAAGAEWRNLLRNPAAYLPLRGPAMLLLSIILAWILANSSDNPLVNLRDLVSIAALVYAILCQIQLLGNRFGNDADAARFLFALPAPRRYMFLGKNIALLALLLPLDEGLAGFACFDAHSTGQLTAAALGCVGAAILLLTSLGNLLSVLAPFPIARQEAGYHVEPDRLVLFAYVILILIASFVPFYGFHALSVWMPWSFACVSLLLGIGGLYIGTLFLAEWILLRSELRILAALEGRQQ